MDRSYSCIFNTSPTLSSTNVFRSLCQTHNRPHRCAHPPLPSTSNPLTARRRGALRARRHPRRRIRRYARIHPSPNLPNRSSPGDPFGNLLFGNDLSLAPAQHRANIRGALINGAVHALAVGPAPTDLRGVALWFPPGASVFSTYVFSSTSWSYPSHVTPSQLLIQPRGARRVRLDRVHREPPGKSTHMVADLCASPLLPLSLSPHTYPKPPRNAARANNRRPLDRRAGRGVRAQGVAPAPLRRAARVPRAGLRAAARTARRPPGTPRCRVYICSSRHARLTRWVILGRGDALSARRRDDQRDERAFH